jgi:release factor glutamine methyltransferase
VPRARDVGATAPGHYAGAVAVTIASALRSALAALAALPSPRSDGEELLSRLLGLTRSELHLQGGRALTAAESSRFEAWLARRATHEPVQYITGRAAFRGLDLAVGPEVLIPRPETEGLVEAVLGLLRAASWPAPRVLDLGTGSGAIALALALEWPAAVVTATEASGPALERARANAAALGLAGRVRFAAGRWFGAVGEDERFEAVVSNPPYIAAGEWDALPEDVRGFEPRAALLAGASGLDDLRTIVDGAPRHLVPGGLLALELAEMRAAEVAGWLRGSPAWKAVEVRADLAGRPRCLLARSAAVFDVR